MCMGETTRMSLTRQRGAPRDARVIIGPKEGREGVEGEEEEEEEEDVFFLEGTEAEACQACLACFENTGPAEVSDL